MAAKADSLAKFIQRALIGRWDNSFKVTFARSTEREPITVEYWLVPQGVVLEKPRVTIVGKSPLIIEKKMLFAEDTSDPCSNDMAIGFAKVLKSNLNSVGYIVDFNTEKRDRIESAQEWLNLFRKFGIPRRRIRIFFKNKKMPPYSIPYSEYWLVPKK